MAWLIHLFGLLQKCLGTWRPAVSTSGRFTQISHFRFGTIGMLSGSTPSKMDKPCARPIPLLFRNLGEPEHGIGHHPLMVGQAQAVGSLVDPGDRLVVIPVIDPRVAAQEDEVILLGGLECCQPGIGGVDQAVLQTDAAALCLFLQSLEVFRFRGSMGPEIEPSPMIRQPAPPLVEERFDRATSTIPVACGKEIRIRRRSS